MYFGGTFLDSKKLKKMLKKVPASLSFGVIALFSLIAAAIFKLLPAIISLWQSTVPFIVVLVQFVILIASTVFGLCYLFRNIHRFKANGRESIRRLESLGLLEAAAEEYESDQKITLSLGDFKHTGIVFSSRVNTITPNFIFDICENIIYRYEDISGISIVDHTRHGRRRTYKASVLTLKTLDGKAIALMSIPYGIYNQKATTAIKQIVFIMKNKNPECEIDESVPDSCDL